MKARPSYRAPVLKNPPLTKAVRIEPGPAQGPWTWGHDAYGKERCWIGRGGAAQPIAYVPYNGLPAQAEATAKLMASAWVAKS